MPFIRRRARNAQEIDQLIEGLAKLLAAPADQLAAGAQAIQTSLVKIPVPGSHVKQPQLQHQLGAAVHFSEGGH